MTKLLPNALAALKREAIRLGFTWSDQQDRRMSEETAGSRFLRTGVSFRIEEYHAWAYTISVNLDFKEHDGKLDCSAELSWSSTGRSIAMAVAAVALYQRAIEFASLAECIMTGVSIPVAAEVAP